MAHLRNDDQSMEFGGIISIGMMMIDLVFRIPYFQTHPYKNRKKVSRRQRIRVSRRLAMRHPTAGWDESCSESCD